MFLRKLNIKKDGKQHQYWALVESYRTEKGPRQRIVCYLGDVDASNALGIKQAAQKVESHQMDFFSCKELPERIEINPGKVSTERQRSFGGVWLGKKLYDLLGLNTLFSDIFEKSRERSDWGKIIEILVIARFFSPSSELHLV